MSDWISDTEKLLDNLGERMTKSPKKTLLVIGFGLIVMAGGIFVYNGTTYLSTLVFSDRPEPELYRSIQSIHQNAPFTALEYLDIDGKGMLYPMFQETMKASMELHKEYEASTGDKSQEVGYLYENDVVTMVLNPSIIDMGEKVKYSYEKGNEYIFYLPNRNYEGSTKPREHLVTVGDSEYLVTLMTVTGSSADPKYTFRIEEVQ